MRSTDTLLNCMTFRQGCTGVDKYYFKTMMIILLNSFIKVITMCGYIE